MASPLRPGSGVLAGATSPEAHLTTRTTILPALKEAFYRLPELGAIFTRDVLVFRDSGAPLDDPRGELGPKERWWVDVVSAGMLRFPDLEPWGRLGARDRTVVREKMRGVLRIMCAKGARRVVLGAWGCGAYGNPVGDVAEGWAHVLRPRLQCLPCDGGEKKGKASLPVETWDGIEEVVFAIPDARMAREFGGGVEVETVADGHVDEDEGDETDKVGDELRAKILEMEGQLEKVWNADLKQRMGVVLEGLRAQLKEWEGAQGEDGGHDETESEGDDLEDEFVSDSEESSDDDDDEIHDSADDDRDDARKLA